MLNAQQGERREEDACTQKEVGFWRFVHFTCTGLVAEIADRDPPSHYAAAPR
jgi:hypothetical protein